MRISAQAKTRILRLIDEGDSLDHCDVGAFYRWSQASYDALQFDRVQQQRFDEYCRSSLWCHIRTEAECRSMDAQASAP